MARKNPLGKIKDLTAATLKLPATAAGKAVDGAKGAAAAGISVADQVTRTAVSTAGSVVHRRKGTPAEAASEPETEPESRASTAPAEQPESVAEQSEQSGQPEQPEQPHVDTSAPVNVVDELGLDPAPVKKPTPPRKATKAPGRAQTGIDAAADPGSVNVTPADLAEKLAPTKAPGKKSPAKKAAKKAAAKKAPAKKAAAASSTPSAKLPPRGQTQGQDDDK